MATEQTPAEVPQDAPAEKEFKQTPEAVPSADAPPTTDVPPATDAPPATGEETPVTGEETPAKPSAKEKITVKIHETGDKIKASIAGVKQKVSSK